MKLTSVRTALIFEQRHSNVLYHCRSLDDLIDVKDANTMSYYIKIGELIETWKNKQQN